MKTSTLLIIGAVAAVAWYFWNQSQNQNNNSSSSSFVSGLESGALSGAEEGLSGLTGGFL